MKSTTLLELCKTEKNRQLIEFWWHFLLINTLKTLILVWQSWITKVKPFRNDLSTNGSRLPNNFCYFPTCSIFVRSLSPNFCLPLSFQYHFGMTRKRNQKNNRKVESINETKQVVVLKGISFVWIRPLFANP